MKYRHGARGLLTLERHRGPFCPACQNDREAHDLIYKARGGMGRPEDSRHAWGSRHIGMPERQGRASSRLSEPGLLALMRRHKVAPTTAGRSRLARPSAGPESGTRRARHLCRKSPQIRCYGAGRCNGTAHRRKTTAASSGLRQKIPRRGKRRGSLLRSKINGRYRVDTGLISARAPGRASGLCRASPEG